MHNNVLCPFILTKIQKHNKIKHVNDINVHKYHKQQRRKNKNGNKMHMKSIRKDMLWEKIIF